MAKKVLLGILTLLVVFVFVGCNMNTVPEDTKPLALGGVTIMRIPMEAKITYTDELAASRIQQLYKENRLFIFTGSSGKTNTNDPLKEKKSDLNARTKLSEFLDAQVKAFTQRVTGQLEAVQTGDNAKNDQVTATAMKAIEESFSSTKQSGGKVVARYQVVNNNGAEYFAVLMFDPEVLISVIETNDAINKKIAQIGKQSKEVFQNLNDVLKEAYKNTPMEQK